jgi:kynureninase
MLPEFRPAAGAAGWAVTLELFRQAGIEDLRAKSMRLTAYAERLLLERCRDDVQIITPSAPAERGCQLSFRVAGGSRRGRRVFDALSARGIMCDWREPDIIRIAPAPLYNRFVEVFELVEQLSLALKEIG